MQRLRRLRTRPRRHGSTSPTPKTCKSMVLLLALGTAFCTGKRPIYRQLHAQAAEAAHHISPASPSPHKTCHRCGLYRVRPPYVTPSP